MVLIVTINPLLEKRNYFPSVKSGKINFTSKIEYTSGGSGLNISRQLNRLGIKNLTLTYLGGASGKVLRQSLIKEGVNFTAVSTQSDINNSNLIIEEKNKKITSYIDSIFSPAKKEVSEFKSKLEKMIPNSSIIVFAGSSPSELTDEIFPFGIELANKFDKISILNTVGSHYDKCIESKPFATFNFAEDLKTILNRELSNENMMVDYLKLLYGRGSKLNFIKDKANIIYSSKFDFIIKISPPKLRAASQTGLGDSFISGIIYGLEKSLVFDDFAKFAAALELLNLSDFNKCSVEKEKAVRLSQKIILQPIGKKMKIINDSPNY